MENPHDFTHNLDVSLFERLSSCGVPSSSKENFTFPLAQLTIQRRMRPAIADLVRIPLYKDLKDHSSVVNLPAIAGMHKPIFWMNHDKTEDRASTLDLKETSHSNTFEVDMVTQLVSHLSKQIGYNDGDIAVLTPYVGQLRKLRDSLGKVFVVELSTEDRKEIDEFDELPITVHIEQKPLAQSVRIATVIHKEFTYLRWTISKERKQKLLLYHLSGPINVASSDF